MGLMTDEVITAMRGDEVGESADKVVSDHLRPHPDASRVLLSPTPVLFHLSLSMSLSLSRSLSLRRSLGFCRQASVRSTFPFRRYSLRLVLVLCS